MSHDPLSDVLASIRLTGAFFFSFEGAPLFRMTVTLTARARQTEMVWRMRFESPEVYRSLLALITKANVENFDRLGRLLFKA